MNNLVLGLMELPTLDISGPLTTALNSTVTNTIAMFSAVIPFGLLIFTAKFCYVKGVDFFANLAKK